MAGSKAKSKNKEKTDLFVGIKEPSMLRKEILNASKDAINIIKEAEFLKELHKEITEREEILNKNLDELMRLIVKFNSCFPKIPKLEKEEKKERTRTKQEKNYKKTSDKKTNNIMITKSKIEMLEEELRRIEEKIKRIA